MLDSNVLCVTQEEDVDDDAEATLVIDWNRVAADVNYRETIVLAAEAQAIVDKERADEVRTEPHAQLAPVSAALPLPRGLGLARMPDVNCFNAAVCASAALARVNARCASARTALTVFLRWCIGATVACRCGGRASIQTHHQMSLLAPTGARLQRSGA